MHPNQAAPCSKPAPAKEHGARANHSSVPQLHQNRAEPESRLTLAKTVILLVVTTAVLGPAIAFSPAGTFFGSIITPLVRHHQLKTRGDSQEIGRLMVAMLENAAPDRAVTIRSSDPRMPARLRQLGGVSLSLDPVQGFADLSCGGRSYHFGYTVAAAGDRLPAEYQMTCYGERVDDLVDLGVIKWALPGEQIARRSNRGVRSGF